MKNVTEWTNYIEKIHPKNMELELDRIKSIGKKLGLTRFNCPVLTVGGTNGKGSCVKLIESIASMNNYRIGVYTSPHLLNFNERIKINNREVSDSQLITAFEFIEAGRKDIPLTFFEFTTLAALWLFKQIDLDLLILEVGLGGRLDAVNIVDPDIAIITSIDLDHEEWLGTTREQIALEKAGIFRSGRLAICGDPNPPASLLDYAKEIDCQIFLIKKDYSFDQNTATWSWVGGEKRINTLPIPNLSLINAATALMAIHLLDQFFHLSFSLLHRSILNAALPGRFQRFDHPINCILDVAHNPAATDLLMKNLLSEGNDFRLKAVVGMMKDKDIANTLLPCRSIIKEWHFATLNHERGASSAELAANFEDFEEVQCYNYDTVLDAFKSAAAEMSADQRIIVFGSFVTVAEVLNYLKNYVDIAVDVDDDL